MCFRKTSFNSSCVIIPPWASPIRPDALLYSATIGHAVAVQIRHTAMVAIPARRLGLHEGWAELQIENLGADGADAVRDFRATLD